MNYEQLKANFLLARKHKMTLQIKVLGDIVDKTQKLAKIAKDDDLNKYVASAIKSAYKQTLDAKALEMDVDEELEILVEMLPETLNAADTILLIIEIKNSQLDPNMGSIMKILKTNEDVDMKMAKSLVLDVLKG